MVVVCVPVCGRNGIIGIRESLFSPYLLLYGVVRDSEGEELTMAVPLLLAPLHWHRAALVPTVLGRMSNDEFHHTADNSYPHAIAHQ